MDDQTAALTAALAYLQQLNDTVKSQALQPPLPPISGSLSVPAGTIEQSISQHLNALITYLDAGAFLNLTEDEVKTLNEEMARYVRETLTEPLSDKKLAECADQTITGPIRAQIEKYVDRAKTPISIQTNVTQSLQSNITAIRTGLEGELANVKTQPVNYTLPKSSTDFIQNIAKIRAHASPLLHEVFRQQTEPLRADIASFVAKSVVDIENCHGAQLSAEAERVEADRLATERAASLREYLRVLNEIPGMPAPPESGPPYPAIQERISSRLRVLLDMVTKTMKEKTDEVGSQQSELTKLITDTGAKLAELRKFADERLVMCNEQTLLDKHNPELKRIITGLVASLLQLRTAHAENTGKLAELGNDASKILGKISAANLTSKRHDPILLVTSIEGIRDDYVDMTSAFDAFTAAVIPVITDSGSKLAQYTQDAATVTREIEACIDIRKTAAEAMVAEATRLEAELTQKYAQCKQRIGALEAIANTETENPGLKSQLTALKEVCSNVQGQLQAMDVTGREPIASVSGYQTILGGAGAGASELNILYESALKSINTLTKQNNELKEMLAELRAGESNTDAIKRAIELDTAEADARKAEEERVAAAANVEAVADKAVVELADIESVSIYIPTPVAKRPQAPPQAGKQSVSSSQSEPLELEEVEPETILEFVVERPAKPGAGSRGGSIRHRGKRHVLQRGGLGEGDPIVLRITRLTPEVRTLLLNFNPLKTVLTPELFQKIIKDVPPMSRQDAEVEYNKIEGSLISSRNANPYFVTLGQRVAWNTSIMKLMNFLDEKNPRKGISYSQMYYDLWTFMEYEDGSISKLREIFRHKKKGDITLAEILLGPGGKLEAIRIKLGWTSRTQNSLFENLFDVFSNCKDQINPNGKTISQKSMFLRDYTSAKNNAIYRFKLNWLILIAFHIYHTTKPETQPQFLINICEFVKHLYTIFVGWMIDMDDASSLYSEFIPETLNGETYVMKTTKLISAESTDGSLTLLREAIRDKLCEIGPTEVRISKAAAEAAAKEAAKAAAKAAAGKKKFIPLSLPPVSLKAQISTVVPPSSSQQPLKVVVPPSSSKALGVSVNSSSTIPTAAISGEHDKANKAAAAAGGLPTYANPSTLSDATATATATATAAALEPTPQQRPVLRPLSPATGALLKKKSPRVGKHTVTNQGGQKRTRKHRPTPSSTSSIPAPTTRRHRPVTTPHSSSSQKRTRRRRGH